MIVFINWQIFIKLSSYHDITRMIMTRNERRKKKLLELVGNFKRLRARYQKRYEVRSTQTFFEEKA